MFLESESGGDDASNDVTSTNPTGGALAARFKQPFAPSAALHLLHVLHYDF
jgi:hypothetical protein